MAEPGSQTKPNTSPLIKKTAAIGQNRNGSASNNIHQPRFPNRANEYTAQANATSPRQPTKKDASGPPRHMSTRLNAETTPVAIATVLNFGCRPK
jgi:hypothetical protein